MYLLAVSNIALAQIVNVIQGFRSTNHHLLIQLIKFMIFHLAVIQELTELTNIDEPVPVDVKTLVSKSVAVSHPT